MNRTFCTLFLVAAALLLSTSCGRKSGQPEAARIFNKKYTNADYYKEGIIQPAVAKKAYLEMLAHYGVPYSKALEESLWITDFNLGDFEHVGMAGIFWVNDSTHGYFGHEIYLLPGQMIPEHRHMATRFPAKFESWKVNHGWAYNFGIGVATSKLPVLPESQKGHITAFQFVKQEVDQVVSLKEAESSHFLLAGENGAIITEFATYHDGEGLRFTNPKVVFKDILNR